MSKHSDRIEAYLAKHPGATRTEARGHGKTPEHRTRGLKQPEKYPEWFSKQEGKAADRAKKYIAQKNRSGRNRPTDEETLFWRAYKSMI